MTWHENLDVLGSWERGVLFAAFVLEAGESAWAHHDNGRRERLNRAWKALLGLDARARADVLERWRAEAEAGLGGKIEALHSSWLDEVLAGEPSRVVRAAREAMHGSAGQRDPCRAAFGSLLPLCDGEAGPLAEKLCRCDTEALLAEIALLGARTLGYSLGGQAANLQARVMATIGEPWAATVAEAAREEISRKELKAALRAASAAVPAAARNSQERLLHIGLVALKSELLAEHPGSPARVAGRLPPNLGRRLLEA